MCFCGQGDASVSCSQPENGFLNSLSLLSSEKAVQELLQQSPVQSTDDHLIEFSDAMRSMVMFYSPVLSKVSETIYH